MDRIPELIKTWTSQSLSYAGRLELLKSVVQGVSCYWLSIFPIPAMVIDRIEGICHTFLWGSKAARVSWRQVCLPKEEGDWVFEIFVPGIKPFWLRLFGTFTQKRTRYG